MPDEKEHPKADAIRKKILPLFSEAEKELSKIVKKLDSDIKDQKKLDDGFKKISKAK